METSFSNAGIVSPGHAYTWASPRAPKILWQSLFRDDVALRLRLRAAPRMWAWCWRFLKECSAERARRSEEHTSELQSLMRISNAVFCLKKHKPCTLYPNRATLL